MMLHVPDASLSVNHRMQFPFPRVAFQHMDHGSLIFAFDHIHNAGSAQRTSIVRLSAASGIKVCTLQNHTRTAIRQRNPLPNFSLKFKRQRIIAVKKLCIHIVFTVSKQKSGNYLPVIARQPYHRSNFSEN